ncbi:MAG TPA: 2,3-diaminopropionate biosynthesis protein SbnA [Baekduia sp.]|nr:2,3-diaminopropionate biosynthesis protein SbnA [Baekduia sp.]
MTLTDIQRGARAPREGILDAAGNTPLVALRRYLQRPDVELYAKLESCYPGGSAKDRSATRMLTDAIDAGLVGPDTTVIESTSGNLGIGLARVCRYYDLALICVVDSRAHKLGVATMRALGADVRIVEQPDPETGDLLTARLNLVASLVAEADDAFWPNQYANHSNPAAHADGTMAEIDAALDGDLDYLFVATSTTGTLRGCAEYLQACGRETTLIAVDAVGSALFDGVRGTRLLPGFGAGRQTELSRAATYDQLLRIDDLGSVVGCRRLVEREAVFAGASSGAVAVAVEQLAPDMPSGSRCAIVLADGGAGYLDTVYDDDWVRRGLGATPDDLARFTAATNRH